MDISPVYFIIFTIRLKGEDVAYVHFAFTHTHKVPCAHALILDISHIIHGADE